MCLEVTCRCVWGDVVKLSHRSELLGWAFTSSLSSWILIFSQLSWVWIRSPFVCCYSPLYFSIWHSLRFIKCRCTRFSNVSSKFMSTWILTLWLNLEIESYRCNSLRLCWIWSVGLCKSNDWCSYKKAIWRYKEKMVMWRCIGKKARWRRRQRLKWHSHVECQELLAVSRT